MLKRLLIFLLILNSTACISQNEIDAVLLSFRQALDANEKKPEETFKVYLSQYERLWTNCENKYLFFKAYSNFHYDNAQDYIVLQLQKDSILPLQRKCLPEDHDEITTTIINIARSYFYLCLYQEEDMMDLAESYFVEVSNRQSKRPKATERFAQRYYNIADFYYIKGDLKKASLYFERAFDSFQGDENSRLFFHICLGRADCQTDNGNYSEAIEILTELINRYDDRTEDYEIESTYERLALAYRKEKKYALAEKAIVQARKLSPQDESSRLNDIILASSHGAILKSQEKFGEAHLAYQEAKEMIMRLGEDLTIEHISGLNEDLADLYYKEGKITEAIQLYHKGISELVLTPAKNSYSNPNLKDNEIFHKKYLHRQLGLKAKSHYTQAGKNQPHQNYTASLDAILKYDSLGHELLKENWEEKSHQQRIAKLSPFYLIGIQSALRLYQLTDDEKYLYTALKISSNYKSQLLNRGISFKEKKKEILDDSLFNIERHLQIRVNDFETTYLKNLASGLDSKESLRKYVDEKSRLDKFHLDNGLIKDLSSISMINPPSAQEIQSELHKDEGLLEYFISEDSIYSFLLTKNEIAYSASKYEEALIDDYLDWLIRGDELVTNQLIGENLLILLDENRIDQLSKLTIIPDRKLLKLPFEALYLNGQLVLEKFDVSYQYSTSFLYRETSRHINKNFVGFASNYQSRDTAIMFAELPYAMEELRSAQKLLNGQIFLNASANKANFIAHSGKSGILHLALHSQQNYAYPDQSSLIFQSGDTYEHLTATEIYNLDLSCDLTVLSACNTAAGEINPGDGVRSITRSFIHAGSNSVLTTLWEAPDVSTSEIIRNFYQELKDGSSKDQALRNAKLEYLEQAIPSYQHPKYWAHLVLIGDNSSMDYMNSRKWHFWTILSLCLIALIILLSQKLNFKLKFL